jgi:hypothetical protein
LEGGVAAEAGASLGFKTELLHYILYAFTFFAGVQQIMSKPPL